ncbi:hypothetical protein Tco_0720124 [Tanacetum coccineum]
MENSPDHVENFYVYVKNSLENSHEQLENSPNHMENSHVHVENSTEQMEISPDHVEKSHVHLENSPNLSGDPFGFTPLNSNQSGNEAVESVAYEGVPSLGTIESVPKNMSPGGSKHDHVDSLALSPKPINVKAFWGNRLCDFATSSARGKWLATGSDLLFMSVYSPQDMPRKRQLWAYITGIINRWHGELNSIQDSWNNDGVHASNAMILFENKLKSLKQTLKTLSIQKKSIREHDRRVLQEYLLETDSRLDKGEGLPDDLPNRANTFQDIGVIDIKISVDMAQKDKVKWAIEMDENSKFFHDIVNKKRRQQAIKGILVDGEWIDNPDRVKREFYNHFVNKFSAPHWSRVPMECIFPGHLVANFYHDLEGDIFVKET